MITADSFFFALGVKKCVKLVISVMTGVGLALTCTALADNYNDLAEQGYRWVTVNGPCACNTEQDVERITAHHTDAAELDVVQNIKCYYLIPGTIVQVITQDPARGMSEMRLAGVPRPLWTYTRFLSKHPIQDLYGVIETPENSGLLSSAHAPSIRPFPSNSSTARTRSNGIP